MVHLKRKRGRISLFTLLLMGIMLTIAVAGIYHSVLYAQQQDRIQQLELVIMAQAGIEAARNADATDISTDLPGGRVVSASWRNNKVTLAPAVYNWVEWEDTGDKVTVVFNSITISTKR